MIAMLPFLAVQAANVATPAAPPAPGVWAALAPIPYRQPPKITNAMDTFVANEIGTGRCKIAKPADGHYVVTLDVIVQVTSDGIVRRAVPRAIDCPTVEQYGVGLITGFARANIQPGAAPDQWFRTMIVFDWQA
jgi:hypothetical protein